MFAFKTKFFLPRFSQKEKSIGFTLIELLVVLAVIALIASVVTVHLKGARERAKLAKTMQWSASIYHLLGAEARGVWNFNEGAYNTCSDGKDVCDISGNGNNGEIHNDGAVWVDGIPGMTGKALYFDGNDYVDCGEGESLKITGKEITLEAWINLSTFKAISRIFIYNPSPPMGRPAYMLSTENQNFSMIITDEETTSWNTFTATNVITSLGIWYHVAGTYNGSTVDLYINGERKNSILFNKTIDSQDGPLHIGKGKNGMSSRYFNGTIDEVKIYAEALPETVIKQHYLAGLKKHQNLAKK